MKKLWAVLAAFVMIFGAAAAAAEGAAGEAMEFLWKSHEAAVTPVAEGAEFLWKGHEAAVTLAAEDTETYGSGNTGGKMLLVRVESREETGFPCEFIDQRLFALVTPSGKAVQAGCYVIPALAEKDTAIRPGDTQPYFDLLFGAEALEGANPAELQLAVYEERNAQPSCLVPLGAVPASAGSAAASVIPTGDFAVFGHYEQNGDESSPEPIEWIILDSRDGKLLLLSSCSLDFRPYNDSFGDVTWETCSLRAWLNGDFLEAAFTEEEQAAIALTRVDNSSEQGYFSSSDGGADTEDRVFALSWKEFKSLGKSKKTCSPSAYAKAAGGNDTAWWLRSPGMVQIIGALVRDGSIVTENTMQVWNCVRPALWVDESAVRRIGPEERGADKEATPFNTGHVRMKFGFAYDPGFAGDEQYAYENSLEWLVLEIRDGRALVTTDRALVKGDFDRSDSWADSRIRSWLQWEFLPLWFTGAESAAVDVTVLENAAWPDEDEEYGAQETTEDRAFIFSADEAKRYFAGNACRICLNTKGEADEWWLRDHAASQRSVGKVKSTGVPYRGAFQHDCYVRPAMRIDLHAVPFTRESLSETPDAAWHRETAAVREAVPSLYDKLEDLKVGDTVAFGKYTDTRSREGIPDLEWTVLDVADGKALLLARAALYSSTYYQADKGDLWATSRIRAYLNGDFLRKSFTARERVLILATDVDNSLSQGPERNRSAASGNTTDRVFLLSYAEVKRYLPTNRSRRGTHADYLYEGRTATPEKYYMRWYYTEDGYPSVEWWLRGVSWYGGEKDTSLVYHSGALTRSDHAVYHPIRPAMWVSLDPELAAYGLDRRIVFPRESYAVYTGKTLALTPEILRYTDDAPEKTVLEWSAGDKAVATVSNGTVKGLSAGKTTVTARAKDNGEIFTSVEVEVRTPVKALKADQKNLSLLYGAGAEQASGQLSVTVAPADAFHRTVRWSSSDEAVAAVDGTGTVTAVSPGKAVITAVSDDPSAAKATFPVTVLQAVTALVPDQEAITLQAGKTAAVKLSVEPAGAASKKVSWSSSDDSIATVSSDGKIRGVSAGQAVITATALDGSGVSVSIAVTVEAKK